MASTANNDQLQEARAPIASLISKSEKALQKLAPGTWQHTRLRDNLKALHIASMLINNETKSARTFTPDDLREAKRTLGAMMVTVKRTKSKFLPKTSQHTLQQNRLKAFRIAVALIDVELDRDNAVLTQSPTDV
jgi:hypothetical protein